MTFYKKKDNSEVVNQLKKEIGDSSKWFELYQSTHGKFLMEFIDKVINETVVEEDRKDVYSMDADLREYFFASARSKRQTLRAIKDLMFKSAEEMDWRQKEIAKLEV